MNDKIEHVAWTSVFPSLKLAKAGREALQPARLTFGLVWAANMFSFALSFCAYTAIGGDTKAMDMFAGVAKQKDAQGLSAFALDLSARHPLPMLLFVFAAAVSTLFCGGFISRFAAVKVATGQSGRLREASAAFRARAGSLALSPVLLFGIPAVLLPLLALAGHALQGAALGRGVETVLLGMLLLIGLVAGLALIVGGIAALLLIPAITVDGNDGFDAPGRAASYVLGRPWQLAAHLLALAFFGAVSIGLAGAAMCFVFKLTLGAMTIGGAGRLAGGEWEAAQMCFLFLHCVVLAYAFSFLITGITRIYFLLRESADGVPETELWQPSDDQKVTMGVEEEQAHG